MSPRYLGNSLFLTGLLQKETWFVARLSVAEFESGNCGLSLVWAEVPVDEVLFHYLYVLGQGTVEIFKLDC